LALDEDTYTPAEAAKILRYTERHVRKLLADGELEGERDEESGRWRVYQHSVHAMLPDRPSRVERSQEPLEDPERLRDLEGRMQALNDRIAALQHDLGRAQTRAELTELAESTLREQLERERERADQERERAGGTTLALFYAPRLLSFRESLTPEARLPRICD
jgi:excisionase family DNA binding protein